MRCWARDHPPKNPSPTSPAAKILATPPKIEADWTLVPDVLQARPPAYLPNPTEFWVFPLPDCQGPGIRATGNRKGAGLTAKERQEANQGRRLGDQQPRLPRKSSRPTRPCSEFAANGSCNNPLCQGSHVPPETS
jgi:hypothetical protein